MKQVLKSLLFGIVLAIVLAVSTHTNMAMAQTSTTVSALTDPQTMEVIFVGFLGGLLLAYQTQSKQTTPWDWHVFFNTVIQSVIITIPVAVTNALTQTNLNLLGLVLVFFAAIGATVQLQQSRQKSVPLSARKT